MRIFQKSIVNVSIGLKLRFASVLGPDWVQRGPTGGFSGGSWGGLLGPEFAEDASGRPKTGNAVHIALWLALHMRFAPF